MNPVHRRVRRHGAGRGAAERGAAERLLLGLLRPAVCGALALAVLLALSPRATLATATQEATSLAATSQEAASEKSGSWLFPSDSALNPPSISVTVHPKTTTEAKDPTYLFLAPIQNLTRHESFVGKPGPEIIEADGNPVWEDPLGNKIHVGSATYKEVAMDLHTDTFEKQPVLVWWQGHITPNGYGTGRWEIVNDHYQPIAHLSAPKGYETDFHAIEITSNGMAYFLGSKVVHLSLTCCGGPANGELYDQVLFEAELKTGKITWSWNPLQYIPLKESQVSPPHSNPWDPYHINSIAIDGNGNIILSARNTSAAYWIRRPSGNVGEVFARLGGKHSTFALGKNVEFHWQHDVSITKSGQISVFADEATPNEGPQSRGLLISLNWETRNANLVHEYLLPHPALAGSQGSVQVLPGGNVFVGWGQLPFFSEYEAGGKLVYLGSLHSSDESYRTYKESWVGLPSTKPSIQLTAGSPGYKADVHASWNGATEVASWQLLAGASSTTLTASGTAVTSAGFETTIGATTEGPFYAVEALNKAGEVLATSPAAQLTNSTGGAGA